ncbi:hypothetical protein L210DRAFT_3518146, partial [Boletus edulis BED1]
MSNEMKTCYPSDSDQLLNEIRPDEVLRLQVGRARYIRFIMNSSSRYLYDETQ